MPSNIAMASALICLIILWRMPKVRKLCAMVVYAVAAAILIKIDAIMPLPVHFPRTPAECLAHPERVLRLLRVWLAPAKGGLHWRLEHASAMVAVLEPDKAPLRAPLHVYDGRDEEPLTHLFCKTGDARSRGLPLWLTALASFSGNREVFFYRHVRSLLPHIDAPRALLAAEVSLLGRWCLVLTDMCPGGALPFDRRDGATDASAASSSATAVSAAAAAVSAAAAAARKPARVVRRRRRSPLRSASAATAPADASPPTAAQTAYVVPDRVGCTQPQALAVVRGLARLHATFWATAHTEPALRQLTAGRGARGYVASPAVALLLGRTLPKLPRLAALWRSLGAALADAPATLLHGDCRPENLLFRTQAARDGEAPGADSDAATASCAWRVTFLDWEAVGINPAANDLIYFMVVGLRAADSAAWQSALLRAYHAELSAELRRQQPPGGASIGGAGAGASPDVYSLAVLEEHVALLGCVLLVVQVRQHRVVAAAAAAATAAAATATAAPPLQSAEAATATVRHRHRPLFAAAAHRCACHEPRVRCGVAGLLRTLECIQGLG